MYRIKLNPTEEGSLVDEEGVTFVLFCPDVGWDIRTWTSWHLHLPRKHRFSWNGTGRDLEITISPSQPFGCSGFPRGGALRHAMRWGLTKQQRCLFILIKQNHSCTYPGPGSARSVFCLVWLHCFVWAISDSMLPTSPQPSRVSLLRHNSAMFAHSSHPGNATCILPCLLVESIPDKYIGMSTRLLELGVHFPP